MVELFPPGRAAGLFPVGRLDRDTEGLLLLTNDGELAARLLHPRHHVEKTYVATVDGVPERGRSAAAARGRGARRRGDVACEGPGRAHATGTGAEIELIIREGRKRQVRRMCGAIGHPVTRLVRVAFGPLRLEGLEIGEVRELSADEVSDLRRAAGA